MCIGICVHVCVILYHRRYFGEKVGIYFTWIGFYTTWLLPISLLGIVIFLYGLSTIPLYRNAVAYVVIYAMCMLFCAVVKILRNSKVWYRCDRYSLACFH